MASGEDLESLIRFGAFAIDLESGELRKHGLKIKLRDQSFQVLALLLKRQGQVVTREELQRKLWATDTFVDFERGLNKAINRLREALGDSADHPSFIETLPKRGYRFIAVAEMRAALETVSVPAPIQQPSIAVLPFANMSSSKDEEYFSDGLAEEIINLLAQIAGLKVTARTSVFAFKGKNEDIRRIAEALGVTYVLEGSVRRAGNRLRITAELIHAADGTHLWSQRYDREMADVFAVQDEIAGAIATSLRVRMELTPQEHRRFANRRPVETEAHEAYLKGRYFWSKRTKEGLERAIRYFREATEKGPSYALAYAGLADSYFLMASPVYGGLRPTEAQQMGKLAAYRAIEIDEMLPEAHTALAQLRLTEFDWASAQKELQRSIELNSSYATAYHWYGLFLSALGSFDDAIAAAKVACCLDPLSAIIARDLGLVFYYARQLDRAVEQYRKTLDFEPDFAPARQSLGRAYLDKGMYDEGLQEIEKADALSGGAIYTRAALAQAFAVIGRTGEANKILAELTAQSRSSHVPPTTFAVIYTALDDSKTALDWLEKAYAEHDIGLHTLKVHPVFDTLRHELRFQNLLRHMNLL